MGSPSARWESEGARRRALLLMARILVTDGETRSALAVVRSLGRAGHEVHVCSSDGRSLAGRSRYAVSDVRVPSALTEPRSFVEAVERETARLQADVLLPLTDASIPPLLDSDVLRRRVTLPFPSPEAYRAATDKGRLLQTAERVGIRAPPTVRVASPTTAGDPLSLEFGPPYVVKPTLSVSGKGAGRSRAGVSYAGDGAELRRCLEQVPPAAYPVLVQRRIRGRGRGIFLLRWEGRTLASFAHARIREKPPSGGVSVYRESVRAEPELADASERLLGALDWEGVAMVEYKVAADSGTPYLMEVNGRFWGSLQLAIDAGVDFPALLVDAALGGRPEPVSSYRTGIRSRWWWGDVDHLLARLCRTGSVPDGGWGGRPGALADFLVLWRPGDRSEVLRLQDPAPFLEESRRWLRDALGGGDGPT